MRLGDYETHPAADLFPMLEGDELQALADDIKEHGLANPIVYLAGTNIILDGRNRYLACEMASVLIKMDYWQGMGSPTEWVISQNLHRRHLSESQRSMLAAKSLVPHFTEEARVRQGARTDLTADLREGFGTAAAKAAQAVKVSPRLVESAIRVSREASSEVIEAVEAGKLTVSAAEKELRARRPGAKRTAGSPRASRKPNQSAPSAEALGVPEAVASAPAINYPAGSVMPRPAWPSAWPRDPTVLAQALMEELPPFDARALGTELLRLTASSEGAA